MTKSLFHRVALFMAALVGATTLLVAAGLSEPVPAQVSKIAALAAAVQ